MAKHNVYAGPSISILNIFSNIFNAHHYKMDFQPFRQSFRKEIQDTGANLICQLYERVNQYKVNMQTFQKLLHCLINLSS